MSAKRGNNPIYSKMGEFCNEQYTMALNSSYGTRDDFSPKLGHSNGKQEANNSRCLLSSIIILFIYTTLLMFGVIGACIFFVLEMNVVKSETTSLVKASSDINASLQVINASLHMLILQVNARPDEPSSPIRNLSNFVNLFYQQVNIKFQLVDRNYFLLGQQLQDAVSANSNQQLIRNQSSVVNKIQQLNSTLDSLLIQFQNSCISLTSM